ARGALDARSWLPIRSRHPFTRFVFRFRRGPQVAQEQPTVPVLQVEDRVQGPVEVVGELGRLREKLLLRRPRHSPRRPCSISLKSTSKAREHSGQVTEPTTSPSVFRRSYRR